MKKFFNEFKEFALKGNVMSMAVGIIIGGAFTAIINSLVDDIINPLLGLIVKVDFADLETTVFGATFRYGAFIMAVINFILVALVLFCIVRAMNKVMDAGKKPEPEAEPTEKECPYCAKMIPIKAKKCPECTSDLD